MVAEGLVESLAAKLKTELQVTPSRVPNFAHPPWAWGERGWTSTCLRVVAPHTPPAVVLHVHQRHPPTPPFRDLLSQVLATLSGAALEGCTYRHPLFERLSPVVVGGDYITTDSGTGLVHTAPGHGQEDYQV